METVRKQGRTYSLGLLAVRDAGDKAARRLTDVLSDQSLGTEAGLLHIATDPGEQELLL